MIRIQSEADELSPPSYILNRGWIDREGDNHIPSYDEIVGEDAPTKKKKSKSKSKLLEDAADGEEERDEDGHVLNPELRDDDDDEIDEEADEFESRYNFRFEQE